MTFLITSIGCGDWATMVQRAGQALAGGADLVELRLDALDPWPDDISGLVAAIPAGRWLATYRSQEEGGFSRLSAADRLERLRQVVASGAGFIDLDLTLIESAGPVATEVSRLATAAGVDVIRSRHQLVGSPDQPDVQHGRGLGTGADAIEKLAWPCDDVCDNFIALERLREAPGRRMAICMGQKGILSRVLARKLEAFGTFCALSDESATAPGQITLGEMLDLYGWRRHTGRTKVFGVIGSRVGHSLSPALFNAQFAADGFDAVYLPLLVDTADEFNRFLDGCRDRPWLDVRGFSVTTPHKSSALKWASAEADSLARRIGAANTLLFEGTTVRAFNTDYAGARAALEGSWGVTRRDLRGLPVVVLGAGGVARALVAGLCDQGCRVTIYNRTVSRGRELADDFGYTARPWEERAKATTDLLINCTSVGMAPRVNESPFPA